MNKIKRGLELSAAIIAIVMGSTVIILSVVSLILMVTSETFRYFLDQLYMGYIFLILLILFSVAIVNVGVTLFFNLLKDGR